MRDATARVSEPDSLAPMPGDLGEPGMEPVRVRARGRHASHRTRLRRGVGGIVLGVFVGSVYHGDRDEPFSLLVALQRVPATAGRVPREDQLTTVLAWLCSLSDAVARGLMKLLLDPDDTEALGALADRPIRVRTQVRLPPLPGTGELIADLSLAVPDRALQMLVEVKLDAPIASYQIGDEAMIQPAAYLKAWEEGTDPQREALVKRVGTLTRDGFESAPSPGRARDVTWSDVRTLVARLLDDDTVGLVGEPVARDLVGYVARLVEPPDAAMLDEALPFMREFVARLASSLPGAIVSGEPQKYTRTCCIQSNLENTVGAESMILWVAFTPERSRYSPVGWPDALQLAFYSSEAIDAGTSTRLQLAGFEPLPDGGSWRPYRIRLDWADVLDQPEAERLDHAVNWGIAGLGRLS
jgi:hypothetical protein